MSQFSYQSNQSSISFQQSLSSSIEKSKSSSLHSKVSTAAQQSTQQQSYSPSMWKSLSTQFNKPLAHHFFDAQLCIESLFTNLQVQEYDQIMESLLQLQTHLNKIQTVIQSENIHFIYSILKLISSIDQFSLKYNQKNLKFWEIFTNISEIFAKLALTYFMSNEEETDNAVQPFDYESDGSSDFSDDQYQVEDFEEDTTLLIVNKIKKQLVNTNIYEQCKSFNFIQASYDVNIKEFFVYALNLKDISSYEVLCFLNNLGITNKVLSYKKGDPLKDFISNLQQIINKILTTNQPKNLVSQYSFDFRYSQFSKKSFYYKSNILQTIQKEVLIEKIDRWKLLNEQQLSFAGMEKREFRRFIVHQNIPINRFETHILHWLNAENTQISQQGENQNKLADQILLFYPLQEPLLEYMMEVDLKQSGFINFYDFYKWIQLSAIPCNREEAKRVFDEQSQVVGTDSLQGIKAEKLLDYNRFLNGIYGIETQPRQNSDLFDKYNNENLNKQKVAHQRSQIHHQNQKIKILEDELQKEKEKNIDLLSQISEKDQQLAKKDDDIKQFKYHFQRASMSADIENCSKLANLKNESKTEQVIRQQRWESEKMGMQREIQEKDRQIQAYRMEIENILSELKTQRNEL